MTFSQSRKNKFISIEEAIAAILNMYNPIDEHSNEDFLTALDQNIDEEILEEKNISKKKILEQIRIAHFYRYQMYRHLKIAMEEEIRLIKDEEIESTLKATTHLGNTKVEPQSAVLWGIKHNFYKFERNQISEYTTEYFELFMKVKKEYYDFGGEFFEAKKRPPKKSVLKYINELDNRVSAQIATSMFTILNEKEINNEPKTAPDENANQYKNGKKVN